LPGGCGRVPRSNASRLFSALRRRRYAERHQSPAAPREAVGRRKHRPAHRVNDNIEPILNVPRILRKRLRAQGPDEVALPGASGGGDVRAEDRRELDRVPHAAGPALDENAFARLEAGAVTS
jgi:hypothetical protein